MVPAAVWQLRPQLSAQDKRRQSPRASQVRPSGVAGAGDGLHLAGACEAGTVVALYPGTAYLLDDLGLMSKMVLEGNDYVCLPLDLPRLPLVLDS